MPQSKKRLYIEGSHLADDVHFNGTLKTAENLLISGKIRGNIYAQQQVTMSATAQMVGRLESRVIRSNGATVKGDINASELLVCAAHSNLQGTIVAVSLVTEQKAKIEGTISMPTTFSEKNGAPALRKRNGKK